MLTAAAVVRRAVTLSHHHHGPAAVSSAATLLNHPARDGLFAPPAARCRTTPVFFLPPSCHLHASLGRQLRRQSAAPPPPPPPPPPSSPTSAAGAAPEGAQEGAAGAHKSLWQSCSGEVRWGLGVMAVVGGLESVGVGMVVPFLPSLAEEVGLGAMGAGMLVSMASLGRVLANLPAGWFADKVARRPLMVWANLLTAAGIFCTAVAPGLSSLLLARFAVGLGSGAGGVGTSAYTVDLTANIPEHRGVIIGVIGSVSSFAYVLGPALGGLVAGFLGAKGPFYFFSLLTLLSTALIFTVPETVKKSSCGETSATTAAAAAAAAAEDAPAPAATDLAGLKREAREAIASFASLSRIDSQRALVMANVAACVGWAAYLTLLPLHAVGVWGATPVQLGLMFSAASAVGLVGAPLAGHVSDRVGRLPVLMWGAAFNCVGCLLLYFSTSYWTFLGALVVWEIGECACLSVLRVLAADCAPPGEEGRSLSLQRQAEDVTMLVAPLLLGIAADSFFSAGGGLALCAAVCAALYARCVQILRKSPCAVRKA